ncbi:hypothetical protein [Leptolyngbya sp. PCC 6406]|uniref:hypothetical protein n=1 Tax=Leptolyngbya sp. PCC 6406 TaxID=1173264 RepID=UPI0002AC32CE|nr:hypothetical protein [Leptolyngbya sp. PCC 6406]
MYPQPPYVLMVAGFLAAIAAGSAFGATLQQSTRNWADRRDGQSLLAIRSLSLKLPYFTICAGVCVFLASGIQFFGFPANIAYGLALVLTAFMALLVWRQLGVILVQIERGGSKALDLDAF